MKRNIVVGALIITGLILSIGMSSYAISKNNRPIACVQLAKVYEEFTLKKELAAKHTNAIEARKRIVDSMEIQLKAMSNIIGQFDEKSKEQVQKIEEFEYKKEDYLEKKRQLEQDNANMSKLFDEQIWNQLNQYIAEYGKENGFACILGANGSGTVMYSDEQIDVTDEIIKIVNEKYKGINNK